MRNRTTRGFPLSAADHDRDGDCLESLAKSSPLEQHSESLPRLINDKFPDDEPQTGEPIKIY